MQERINGAQTSFQDAVFRGRERVRAHPVLAGFIAFIFHLRVSFLLRLSLRRSGFYPGYSRAISPFVAKLGLERRHRSVSVKHLVPSRLGIARLVKIERVN